MQTTFPHVAIGYTQTCRNKACKAQGSIKLFELRNQENFVCVYMENAILYMLVVVELVDHWTNNPEGCGFDSHRVRQIFSLPGVDAHSE